MGGRAGEGKLATFTNVSDNKKLGKGRCATTYASQVSCPDTCVFKDAGCYAEQGHVGFIRRRLNATAAGEGATELDVAIAEAAEIRKSWSTLPLRLHTLGDCKSNEAAKEVATAAQWYMDRGKTKAWTYTHAWMWVDRENWGGVSVLASCETLAQVRQAFERGYAAAMVVPEHPADGRAYEREGLKLIPCLEQTRGIPCVDCRMCWSDESLLKRRAVITFSAHGGREDLVRASVGNNNQLVEQTISLKLR